MALSDYTKDELTNRIDFLSADRKSHLDQAAALETEIDSHKKELATRPEHEAAPAEPAAIGEVVAAESGAGSTSN